MNVTSRQVENQAKIVACIIDRMQGSVNPWRILLKGTLLFLIFEFALVSLHPNLSALDLHADLNLLRQRFPVSTHAPGDDAQDLGDLDTMFAAHVVSQPKAPNEFRVLILGDSAVWGVGLTPEQTMPGQLDALELQCGNRDVRVYNLSFPRSSATKDLMILDKAMAYQPDMIVWLITWYTLMPKTRFDHWLVDQNRLEFYKLGFRFDFLPQGYAAPGPVDLISYENNALFHILRYEFYNPIELATGLDQIPGPPEQLPTELSSDPTFEGLNPPTLHKWQVSLDQVRDFHELAGGTPVLMVNEPTQVLKGAPNSDIRYNDYYPRWVYDQYRAYVQKDVDAHGWQYLDLWNAFPAEDFTDTPLHLTPQALGQLAQRLAPSIQAACP